MVGRLVEQQQVRREGERQRQRGALFLAARRGLGRGRLVEAEAMQVFDEPRLGAPAVALVGNRFEPAAKREALAQRRRARQLGFLLDQHDREPVARLDLAVVELPLSRDHLQERRLAGAVAADEADALPFADDEVGAIEQRMEAEGELGVLQGEERHVRAGGSSRRVRTCRSSRPRTRPGVDRRRFRSASARRLPAATRPPARAVPRTHRGGSQEASARGLSPI